MSPTDEIANFIGIFMTVIAVIVFICWRKGWIK